jgi:hypothetical protein
MGWPLFSECPFMATRHWCQMYKHANESCVSSCHQVGFDCVARKNDGAEAATPIPRRNVEMNSLFCNKEWAGRQCAFALSALMNRQEWPLACLKVNISLDHSGSCWRNTLAGLSRSPVWLLCVLSCQFLYGAHKAGLKLLDQTSLLCVWYSGSISVARWVKQPNFDYQPGRPTI